MTHQEHNDYIQAMQHRQAKAKQAMDAQVEFETLLEVNGLQAAYDAWQEAELELEQAKSNERSYRKTLSLAWNRRARTEGLIGQKFGPVTIQKTSEVVFDKGVLSDDVLRVFTQNPVYRVKLVDQLMSKPTQLIKINDWRAMEDLRNTPTKDGNTLLPETIRVVDAPRVTFATDDSEWLDND